MSGESRAQCLIQWTALRRRSCSRCRLSRSERSSLISARSALTSLSYKSILCGTGMAMSGAKLPASLECPVDSLLYTIVDPVVDLCHSLGVTPNMVTLGSLMCTVQSLRAFASARTQAALIFWALAYFLDCVDGAEARRYDQETAVGDVADHWSDVLGYLGFVYVAWGYVARGAAWWPLLACVALAGFAVRHLKCQQKYDTEHGSGNVPIAGLDQMPFECRTSEELSWTRWGGVGTANVCILAAMYYYCRSARPS